MLKLKLGKKEISTDLPAFVMGIVNATPDSFYDVSKGGLERVKKLISEGAHIIDLGAESTRPGFEEVEASEEIRRLLPLVIEIRRFSQIPLSIDTRKAEVIKALLPYDIDVINDVDNISRNKELCEIAKNNELSVVLMHGFAGSQKEEPIINQLQKYFEQGIQILENYEIPKEKIIIDPGIGFGKSYEDNVAIIKNADKLIIKEIPFLMALSRKSCIGQMTDTAVENRLAGTIAADCISVLKGAQIIRVHDVKEAVDSLNVMKNII